MTLFVHGVFLNSYLWRHAVAALEGERRCTCARLAVARRLYGDARSRHLVPRPGRRCWRHSARRSTSTRSIWSPMTAGGAVAQIFAVRHPERAADAGRLHQLRRPRQLSTRGPLGDLETRPPPVFSPRSARRSLADVTPFRQGISAAGYEAIDDLSDETIVTYVGPLLSSPERTANTRALAAATPSGDNSQTTEISKVPAKATRDPDPDRPGAPTTSSSP